MTHRVPLEIQGIDLRRDSVSEAVADRFGELAWTSTEGLTVATAYLDQADPVSAVCDLANRLSAAFHGARVVRVYDELVSLSEIASRLGLSREAVRLWAHGQRGGGNFPTARASVSSSRNPVRIWRWRDVNSWLAKRGLDDGFDYLNDQQEAQLNSYFLRTPTLQGGHVTDALGSAFDVTELLEFASSWDRTQSPVSKRGDYVLLAYRDEKGTAPRQRVYR